MSRPKLLDEGSEGDLQRIIQFRSGSATTNFGSTNCRLCLAGAQLILGNVVVKRSSSSKSSFSVSDPVLLDTLPDNIAGRAPFPIDPQGDDAKGSCAVTKGWQTEYLLSKDCDLRPKVRGGGVRRRDLQLRSTKGRSAEVCTPRSNSFTR